MARRSLRPHLNQIRTWVRQGRTDAWVAHQLEVTVQQIEAFKKENDLLPDGEAGEAPGVDFDDEIDLRAEDDALIAAELEAEAARKAEEPPEEDEPSDDDDEPKRRRGRRGGRPRARRKTPSYEGTVDHGEGGDGPWVGPAAGGARGRGARPRATRARSTTARRATACGWTPRWPTTASTPSTGPASARSR